MDLDSTSKDTGGAHEGGGRAHPPRAPPCLMGSPKVHRRTSFTHIYPHTLKLPKDRIDLEFRRRKLL